MKFFLCLDFQLSVFPIYKNDVTPRTVAFDHSAIIRSNFILEDHKILFHTRHKGSGLFNFIFWGGVQELFHHRIILRKVCNPVAGPFTTT